MKIVVIGGSGLIGTKVVRRLRQEGHEVVAASRSSGVDTVTGEGLTEALAGARVVVDVSNSPSFDDKVAMEFFQKAGRNLRAAEIAASVTHHVALSVVGTEHLLIMGYFRAKLAQEQIIKVSEIPYTIVRATQFFEFTEAIAQSATVGQSIRLSPALYQPIASDDVADALANVALGSPANGTIEIAGPDRAPLTQFVGRFLSATHDPRTIDADWGAGYFGIEVNDQSLTPGNEPRLGAIHFGEWLDRSLQKTAS